MKQIRINATSRTDVKPLTFIGICDDPSSSSVHLLDAQKSRVWKSTINSGSVYIYNRIVKQALVAMGDGKAIEGYKSKMKDGAPYLVDETVKMVPVKVVASKSHSIILSQEGDIYTMGKKAH